jgi:putative Mn2+ efflux pump MntP
MTLLSTIFFASALAMDAFAASLSLGTNIKSKRQQRKVAFLCASFFGGFQFSMLSLGWLLANTFAKAISAIDHYIAFFLLLFIGGKMIYEAIKGEENVTALNIKSLLLLSLATSIDAMAAGVTLKAIGDPLLLPSILTGGITFLLSGLGVMIACKLRSPKYSRTFDALGGIVLVVLGIKILVEHLMG